MPARRRRRWGRSDPEGSGGKGIEEERTGEGESGKTAAEENVSRNKLEGIF